MPWFTDQTGNSILLQTYPVRIVSIVPSQTELLHHLGLDNEVIGITKFCIHPQEWFRNKTRVGGTKQVSMSIIQQLQPDLIIANKEENVKEQVEALANDFPVWISDVNNLESACSMILSIGEMVQKNQQAQHTVKQILHEFQQLEAFISKQPPLRTAYLIWKDPYMTAGGDTFINDMLRRCGLENVFAHTTGYPKVEISQLQEANCQLIILSSEPYPFKEKHIHELEQHLPRIKIILADGEMFSWYGSRMLRAAAYFRQLRCEVKS